MSRKTNITYYSAHGEPVWDSNGRFKHFARQCDPVHSTNGYWRFCTHDDDRRTYERGLNTPEAVLIAQDAGDGVYDDIMLRWVPGELDPGNKSIVGTAAAHLETIYNERKLLGKPLSFRGRVPVYPISTDQRLVNYRLTRCGVQQGVLLETTLASPTLRRPEPEIDRLSNDDEQMSPHTTESLPRSASPAVASSLAVATAINTNQLIKRLMASTSPQSTSQSPSFQSPEALSMASQASSLYHTVQPTAVCEKPPPSPSPQAKSKPVWPVRSVLAPVSAPQTTTPVHSGPSTSNNQEVLLDQISPPLLTQKHSREVSPLHLCLSGQKPSSSASESSSVESPFFLPIEISESLGELSRDDDNKDSFSLHVCEGIALSSSENLTPSQFYDIQSASVPCMSCGVLGSHESRCWIEGLSDMKRFRYAADQYG
ncbi:hypothetical protein EJ07DRAFT_153549 [Lizonia empirigonia]|nr:hypothetical protein EJ07DRAFT_153549 [Lizonia empirigonia]